MRILYSAIFDTQGTFDEIKSFSFREHEDRALSDAFLRTKLKKTIWETLVLSTGLSILYVIGRNDDNEKRRKKRDVKNESYEIIENHVAKAMQKYQ